MLPWRAFYSIQLIFYRFLLPSFISGTGSNPRWDHQIWAITTGFGESYATVPVFSSTFRLFRSAGWTYA